MKSPHLAAVLLLTVLFGLVGSLSAAEPPAPAAPVSPAVPAVDGLSPFATAIPAASFCPSFFCPIYYPDDCSCEWIECPNGQIYCGRWNGTSATSAVSKAPTLPLRFEPVFGK